MPSPTISGTLPDQTTGHEAPLAPFLSVTLADSNAGDPADVLTIALSGAGGYLTETSAYGGLAVLSLDHGVYTLEGAAADLQSALQNLAFVSNLGTADAPATTGFTLTLASTLNGTVLASAMDSATSVVDADPLEAPQLNVAAATATTIWRQPVLPFLGAALVNPNPGTTQTLTVTLSGAGGSLTLAGVALPDAATYTFTGEDALLTGDLNQLAFTPGAASAGSTEITDFALDDTVYAAGVAVAAANASVSVEADDFSLVGTPSFAIVVPPAGTVAFQQPFAPFRGGSLADLYPGDAVVGITLTGAAGNLSDAGAPVPLAFADGAYSLTGTQAEVAAALDDLVFTPSLLAPGAVATVTFDFTLTAPGYASTSAEQTLTVSDKPTVSIAWGPQSGVTETFYRAPITPFAGASVVDPDPYATSETLTIAISGGGALSFGADRPGGGSPASTDAGDYVLSGSLGQVNADLQDLIYTPAVNPAGATSEISFSLSDESDDAQGPLASSAEDRTARVFDIVPATTPTLAITALYRDVTLDGAGEQPSPTVTLAGANDPADAGQPIGVYDGLNQLGLTSASASGVWNLSLDLPTGPATLGARLGGGASAAFADAASPAHGTAYAVGLGSGLDDVVGVDNAGDVVGDYALDASGDTGVYLLRNGVAAAVASPAGDRSTGALGIDAAGDVLIQGTGGGTLFEYSATGAYTIFPNATGIGVDAAGDVFFAMHSQVYALRDGAGQAVALPISLAAGETMSVDADGDLYSSADDILFDGAAPVTTLAAPGLAATHIRGAGAGFVWGDDGNGQAFLYNEAAAQYALVAPPGAIATTLVGVAASGEAAGYFRTAAGGDVAFTLAGGVYTDLAPPGALSAQFTAVTASGAFVGRYADANGVDHGFLDENGVVQIFSISTPSGLAPTPVAAVSPDGLQLAGADGGAVFEETLTAACYARGTRLRTARGDFAIEALGVGDRLAVASGGFRPVVWLGRRRVDVKRHPRPDEVRPVRVRAGAFAPGRPRRDLLLSPGHAVAFDGALIPVARLINTISVVWENPATVEYWHVELDAHDVIFAEDLAAESYLDTGNRAAFENGAPYLEAHPDFSNRHWSQTCLPTVFDGQTVTAAKAALLARLEAFGVCAHADADPHLLADAGRIDPTLLGPTRLAFVLPAGARDIALHSHVFTPAHARAQSSDFRSLGLCVAALQIDGERTPLEREDSIPGWRSPEFDAGRFTHRWTDGCTPLPPGARVVIVDLAGFGAYWRRHDQSSDRRAHES